MRLSIIIPAYNEEKRLPQTLREINDYLEKQNYESEIIVVSDGSKDRTCEVVENLIPHQGKSGTEQESKITNLRLICEKINRGKGYGVKIGMLQAKGEFRLFTDADNSTSVDQAEKMWLYFDEGYDVVIGSRDVKGAVLDPPQPLFRRFTGGAFRLVRKIIVGLWGIEDSQCGFKCFTKRAAENIFPKARISRFSFDPEILIIAKKLGYKIKEVPVYWKNDIYSKVKLKSMLKMALDLIKIKYNLLSGKYD